MPWPRLTSATADADVHVLAAGAVSSRHRSGALDLARVGSGLPSRCDIWPRRKDHRSSRGQFASAQSEGQRRTTRHARRARHRPPSKDVLRRRVRGAWSIQHACARHLRAAARGSGARARLTSALRDSVEDLWARARVAPAGASSSGGTRVPRATGATAHSRAASAGHWPRGGTLLK